jgi:hypothetical protein
MRHAVAVALLALVTAAPAAAVTGGYGIGAKLRVTPVALAQGAAPAADKSRSCQAATRRSAPSTRTGVLGNTRRPAVVACEQPPRSNLLTPDAVAKATAAALSVLG